jgi:hypothetical protein
MVFYCYPPGHGQAVCRSRDDVGAGRWEFVGKLEFTNPDLLPVGGTHKPYIVQEAGRVNRAAKIGGRYMLLSVAVGEGGRKFVHRAWSTALAGPWTLEPGELIPTGSAGAFDERHTDAVTGLYFPERNEVVYFYMGYPKVPQARAVSPLGSAQAVAVERVGSGVVKKLGTILPPEQRAGHWASGWVGGLQVFRGKKHRWVGIANASPTAPRADDTSISRQEPPPSLGGFAYCDEEYPVKGWKFEEKPIEWIEDLPAEAVANGEGVNLWRHQVLLMADGRVGVFYNSGTYGREQMYVKWGE